ncbi:HAD family hydrolase [Chitinophagaceae bacterium LB-8]|uniref:HAD family hydrolase n=1 Tax=Paraflavisolibacter caeni TaxID=2982496 RepID=A0A9X3B8P5_9BACT|nr:HAD family hydrolase [Paraflavisolibacter caeni]MCU7551030.1 HAD family hydrolase [Paraflavisolibacter caeni]
MNKKAIIFDLDNTIYPVSSIGDKLFASLYQLIHDSGEHEENFEDIKADILRKPFQLVAATHGFSNELTERGINLLKNTAYEDEIMPFDDFIEIRRIPGERFLVTTGFTKLQYSKIHGMNIEADFKEIHVIDPQTSGQTKKDVFADILHRHRYAPTEVLVIGDDLESEIKAARELGIDTVLYDKYNLHPNHPATYKISDFKELVSIAQ